MTYQHTQRGHWGAFLIAGGVIVVGVLLLTLPVEHAVIAGGIWFLVSGLVLCFFSTLTIEDEGDAIRARFGPVGLFSKRIPYSEISSAEPARSGIIDGWGVHYILGRGMIYNIWGFGCVRISYAGRVVRFGTDEPEALAGFIRGKLEGYTS